jgi:hypothetical protein
MGSFIEFNSSFLKQTLKINHKIYIQSISRVIMSPTELKMQPTIHLQSKPGYGRGEFPGLLCKCIMGCIFNSVGLIIIRKIPCVRPELQQ